MSLQSIQLDEAEIGRHHELYLLSDCFLYLEMASKIKNRFITGTNQEFIGFVFNFVEVPELFQGECCCKRVLWVSFLWYPDQSIGGFGVLFCSKVQAYTILHSVLFSRSSLIARTLSLSLLFSSYWDSAVTAWLVESSNVSECMHGVCVG